MVFIITTPPPLPNEFPPVPSDGFFNQPPDPNLLSILTVPDPPYLVTEPATRINNVSNLKSLLPPTWFPDDDNVLNAIMAAFADSLGTIQARNDWIYLQDRIKTATGIWLDMFAEEFFGAGAAGMDETNFGWMYRRTNESDTFYRNRILFELMAQRNTRAGMKAMLTFWCGGVVPTIIEPWNPNDTKVWDGNGLFYDEGGYWGSNDDPFTTFIITHRAGSIVFQHYNDETASQFLTHTPGIIGTEVVQNTNYLYGGYDEGLVFWVDGLINESQVSDIDLYAVLNRTRPAGTKTFVHLLDSMQLPNDPHATALDLFNYNFILDESKLSDDDAQQDFVVAPPGYYNSYLDLNFILDESMIALAPGIPSQGKIIPASLPGFADIGFKADENAAL